MHESNSSKIRSGAYWVYHSGKSDYKGSLGVTIMLKPRTMAQALVIHVVVSTFTASKLNMFTDPIIRTETFQLSKKK